MGAMTNPDLVQAQLRFQDHARIHRNERLSALLDAGPIGPENVDEVVDAICDLTPPDTRPYDRRALPEEVARNLDADPSQRWVEGPISLLPATWARLNTIALAHGVEVGDVLEQLARDATDEALDLAARRGRAYLDGCSECQSLLNEVLGHADQRAEPV